MRADGGNPAGPEPGPQREPGPEAELWPEGEPADPEFWPADDAPDAPDTHGDHGPPAAGDLPPGPDAPGTVPETEPPAPAPAPPQAAAPPSAELVPGGLSDQDRVVLALESGGGQPRGGAKERRIREELHMSPTRYYQLLNALLDDPAALRHDPVTVNRLRRVRDERRAQR